MNISSIKSGTVGKELLAGEWYLNFLGEISWNRL